MGKSKPLVAGGSEMPHTTIITDSGLASVGLINTTLRDLSVK